MSKQKENGIGWCDYTFNPWIGCTKVSPACDNCYAESIAKRFFKDAKWGNHPRKLTSESNWQKPLLWNKRAATRFNAWEKFKETQGMTDAQLLEQGFIKPVQPKVFCGSMCDVFDNRVNPLDQLDLLNLVSETKNIDWLLLTKRISNAHAFMSTLDKFEGTNNVWLGITVCNQKEADRDIPKLLQIPVEKRFLSIEPMLGRIDLSKWIDQLDWVIVGGETGRNARPMHPEWARSIRDQCQSANVPFYFKQMTKKAPIPENLMIREFPT